MDRGEDVVLDDALGERISVQDVAVPRHERDQHVTAERELADGPSAMMSLFLTESPTFTSGR
jgi:hypothetical protein